MKKQFAVLALAGAAALTSHQALAGDKELAACQEAVKDQKVTTYANGNASYATDKLGCVMSTFQGKYDVDNGFDLGTVNGKKEFKSAVTAFGVSTGTANYVVAVAAKPAADKPKDECKGVIEEHKTASTVGGAVVGGLLGNKLSKGNKIATVGGAVAGGVVANKIADCDKVPAPK